MKKILVIVAMAIALVSCSGTGGDEVCVSSHMQTYVMTSYYCVDYYKGTCESYVPHVYTTIVDVCDKWLPKSNGVPNQ